MDAFTFIIVGGLGALLIALLLIGRYYPGSGADVLDWKPTRSIETEVELEIDDVQQMLEAQNERRRRRGEAARTMEDVEGDVAADLREQHRRRTAYRAAQASDQADLEQLLEVNNERRRRRGERELTAEELRARSPADPPAG